MGQVNYPPKLQQLGFSQLGSDFGGGQPVGVSAQPLGPISASFPTADQDPYAYTADDSFTDLGPIEQRQQLAAQALQAGSSTAPAAGWAGGLARLAQAFFGGRNLAKANQEIKGAREHNAQIMADALKQGDWEKLATADSDQANKLGDMLLQAKLKYMPTERLMTPDEIKSANLPEGTVASVSRTGEMKILNRPSTGIPRGYHYATGPDGQQVLTFIPGGPADPAIIAKNASERRKPAGPDNTGKAPWEMKW